MGTTFAARACRSVAAPRRGALRIEDVQRILRPMAARYREGFRVST